MDPKVENDIKFVFGFSLSLSLSRQAYMNTLLGTESNFLFKVVGIYWAKFGIMRLWPADQSLNKLLFQILC